MVCFYHPLLASVHKETSLLTRSLVFLRACRPGCRPPLLPTHISALISGKTVPKPPSGFLQNKAQALCSLDNLQERTQTAPGPSPGATTHLLHDTVGLGHPFPQVHWLVGQPVMGEPSDLLGLDRKGAWRHHVIRSLCRCLDGFIRGERVSQNKVWGGMLQQRTS